MKGQNSGEAYKEGGCKWERERERGDCKREGEIGRGVQMGRREGGLQMGWREGEKELQMGRREGGGFANGTCIAWRI